MQQSSRLRKICHIGLGASLYLALFLYLGALPFGEAGKIAAAPAFLLLAALIVLEAALRFGGSPKRIRPLLWQRLSGCGPLALLVIAYLLCALLDLSYSPVKAQMLSGWMIPAGGLVLWLGILFYVEGADQLDNLLVCTAAAGLLSAVASLAGFPAQDEQQLTRIILAGLYTGAVFFLSAQYNRMFKAVITVTFAAVMAPSLWRAAAWSAPAALAASIPRQDVMRTAIGQLEGYLTPEILLGRGSGYDITFTQGQGVQNFLLADLLNGGVIRFALGLAVWLCICYFVFTLFLDHKGMSMIYLGALGLVFAQAFFSGKTGFVSDPLFWTFCAMLAAEHAMIKTGRRRFLP